MKFICTIFVLVLAFILGLFYSSELVYLKAVDLDKKLLWSHAEKLYKLAVEINPINAQYKCALSDFILKRNLLTKNDLDAFRQSEKLLIEAIDLNPYWSLYWTKLGEIRLEVINKMILDKKLAGTERVSSLVNFAFNSFILAHDFDPNGFNTPYAIGYDSISMWRYLSDENKEFVLKNLKYALSVKPWLIETMYSRMAEFESFFTYPEYKKPWVDLYLQNKDNLSEDLNILNYTPSDVIENSQWYGTSFEGGNNYIDGNMYWSGALKGQFRANKGNNRMVVVARGTKSKSVYPYMIVKVDGLAIGCTFVTSEEFYKYEYNFFVAESKNIKLRIIFPNDFSDGTLDRNLFIDRAYING